MTLNSRKELNTTFCFSHFDTPGTTNTAFTAMT